MIRVFRDLGYYFTGDGAHTDADGDFQITGRMDDVINVSGHRLGTAEVEDALVRILRSWILRRLRRHCFRTIIRTWLRQQWLDSRIRSKAKEYLHLYP